MLIALLALMGGTAHPSPLPPPLHYRLELTGSLRFEGGAVDTAGRNGDARVLVYLTATMRDSGGGRVARVVIDSATCSGSGILSMAFDTSVARRSQGAWYDVVLIKGAPDAVPEASIRNPLTARVALVMRILFPPAHPALGPDVAFADTVEVLASSDRWEQRNPTVTRWKVTAYDAARVVLDGDVVGIVTVTGRVIASGLVVGHRSVTLSADDVVHLSTISTSQQTLLMPQDNSEIVRAVGTTTATATLLPPHP